MKCPRCQHDNPQGARFCEECATPLARACSNCGTALSATAKFCHACAHPINPEVVGSNHHERLRGWCRDGAGTLMPAGVLLMSHSRDTLHRATRSGNSTTASLRQGGLRGARDGKPNGCSYRDYHDAVRNLHARLYLRFCEYAAGERPASPGARRPARIPRSCKPTRPFHHGHGTACQRPAEKPRYLQEDTVGPDRQVERATL